LEELARLERLCWLPVSLSWLSLTERGCSADGGRVIEDGASSTNFLPNAAYSICSSEQIVSGWQCWVVYAWTLKLGAVSADLSVVVLVKRGADCAKFLGR
jgi:hypothetical protein